MVNTLNINIYLHVNNQKIIANRQGVTIENYKIAIIRDLVYSLKEQDDNWELSVTVHLESGVGGVVADNPIEGFLSVNLVGVAHKPARTHVTATPNVDGEFSTTVVLIIKKVRFLLSKKIFRFSVH